MNIPRKVILYNPADEVTFVSNFSSSSPQECCLKCFNVVKSSVSFPFVLRQIYAKWKLFSKYLYIYLFMFPILRLHTLLHCAFKSFLCIPIFFVSVPGSLLVGRNTLLFTAPPLSSQCFASPFVLHSIGEFIDLPCPWFYDVCTLLNIVL